MSYTVQCICCSACETAIKETPEQAIKALSGIGWRTHEIGAWCPECAQTLFYARRGRKHDLHAGDEVRLCADNTYLGSIHRIGDGYAEVKMASDGLLSVYCIADLKKAS